MSAFLESLILAGWPRRFCADTGVLSVMGFYTKPRLLSWETPSFPCVAWLMGALLGGDEAGFASSFIMRKSCEHGHDSMLLAGAGCANYTGGGVNLISCITFPCVLFYAFQNTCAHFGVVFPFTCVSCRFDFAETQHYSCVACLSFGSVQR